MIVGVLVIYGCDLSRFKKCEFSADIFHQIDTFELQLPAYS